MPRLLLLLIACLALTAHGQQQYGYKVLETKPQSRQNFVQGLEIVGDYLYVGTGNYGQSHLLRYRLADGTLESGRRLNPNMFGEGITVFDGKVYQLTWQNRMALVYKEEDLTPLEWFAIPGEGWGITHNETRLIYSDGSHLLHFLDPTTKTIERSLAVTENDQPVIRLNELEWIDGNIWANVWSTDRIVIIDPDTGEVSGSINLSGLLPLEAREPGTDVLNGIARNPANGDIWVTGKRWPYLYRIELVPLETPIQQAQPATESR